jgi:hypothetical protein
VASQRGSSSGLSGAGGAQMAVATLTALDDRAKREMEARRDRWRSAGTGGDAFLQHPARWQVRPGPGSSIFAGHAIDHVAMVVRIDRRLSAFLYETGHAPSGPVPIGNDGKPIGRPPMVHHGVTEFTPC